MSKKRWDLGAKVEVLDNNCIKYAKLEEQLSNDLLEQFIQQINSVFCSEDENYDLLKIDEIDEDRANAYYYFDSQNTYEKLNFITDFSRSEENISFSFTEDDISHIKAFVVKIGNDEKSLILYKKHYPVNLLKQESVLRFFKSKDKFEKLEHDVINIDKKFDFLLFDDHIIIVNLKTLERFFGYEEVIKETARQNISLIESLDLIEDLEKLEEGMTNKRIAKKINKVRSSPVLTLKKGTVLSFINEHPLLKDKLKINENEKIILDTKKSVEMFIKLLDDDYLKSDLTDLLYDSLSKSNIKA